MQSTTDFLAANRLNWDDRAALHASDTTGSYRIEWVLGGGSSLNGIETSELETLFGGVADKDVVHLQCHIGLDTISLKHAGARSATGLDFSPEAIRAARAFARQAGTDVRFVESDVIEAAEALGAQYDLVFVSWGAINWLADIGAWGRVVASLLRPGGRLYLLEGHPTMNQLDWVEGERRLRFSWRTPLGAPLEWNETQTYTGDTRPIRNTRNYEWIHPLSDVVGAVLGAGLRLDFLHEHERLVWQAFPDMVGEEGGEWRLPEDAVKLPLAFSLGATRTA